MDHLRELIGIISKHKIKGLEPIGVKSLKGSKLQSLYEGIYEGRLLTEEEAKNEIYGADSKAIVNFKKLKSRLEERLLNTIFFIDINKSTHNDIQMAYYTCHKEWAALKILIGKGARLTAIPIAEKLLKKAEKFEFNHIILDVSRSLRFHYSTIDRNTKNYNKYDQYVKKHLEILSIELTAEEYYTTISSKIKDLNTSKPELIQIAKDFAEDLKSRIKNQNSYRLNLFARSVYVYQFQVSNDYANVIKECRNAISFFRSKPHNSSKVAIFSFLLKMLSCHIQLKQFNEGEEVAKDCLSLVSDGTPNWFFIHELLIILFLHTRRFQEAFNVYNTASKHKNFKRLYSRTTEDWKIYEAYINYFISHEEIILAPEQNRKKFRINKFINEVPSFSKDKRGKNIPVLVIHILFLLQQKKYSAVIDRVETINQYTYRYLRKDDTYRSNCFIKMLLQLPKGNFHKQAVLRKAARYEEKLKEIPLELSGQFDEIEIVPYEILWEYVIASLDNKIH